MIVPLLVVTAALAVPPPHAAGGRLPAAGEAVTPAVEMAHVPRADPPPTPPHTGVRAILAGIVDDFAHLPTRGNLLVAAVTGRLRDQPKVSHLGMDLLRAQIVAEGVTEALKFSTRRERPDGSNALSFPSGHAAVTFASATVLERHLGWRHSLVAYAIASYVAASRLHDNRHYLSDVVFGAAVGTIAGRTVTRHGRSTWSVAPVPVPGGVGVAVARD